MKPQSVRGVLIFLDVIIPKFKAYTAGYKSVSSCIKTVDFFICNLHLPRWYVSNNSQSCHDIFYQNFCFGYFQKCTDVKEKLHNGQVDKVY